jgi:phage-related protein
MFYGTEFIFDNISSEVYGFMLVNFNSGKISNQISNAYEIQEEQIAGRVKPIKIGTSPMSKLTFDITIARKDEIDRYDKGVIYKWLFSKDYKKLIIAQDDLSDVVFNCILTNPREEVFFGSSYAVTMTVVCDGPFASSIEMSNMIGVTSGVSSDYMYIPSSANEYIYPKMLIQTSLTTSCNFSIKNLTDSSVRATTFQGLGSIENLTLDNNFGIIKSDGSSNISNFTSKKWFRLLPGDNEIQYTLTNTSGGAVTGTVQVTYIYEYPISV